MAADDCGDEGAGTALIGPALWPAAVVAMAVAWLAVFPVRRHAEVLGLVDRPNQRSSHQRATPRGGGVGIIAGVAAGLLFIEWFVRPVSGVVWAVFGSASAVAAVGLFDDLRGLSPGVRLAAQLSAGIVVVSATGPIMSVPLPAPLDHFFPSPSWGWGFSLLWITAVTNFFNFMDGFDGLAGGQAVASCLGVVVADWGRDPSLLALLGGAGCLGFLWHNWMPARVFMGDVGSGFLGFMLAGLPFLAPPSRRSDAMMAVAVGLSLFLLDPAVTLVRRAWARKRLTQSHREHLYQQLVAPGEPVGRVVTVYLVLAVLLSVAGGLSYQMSDLSWLVVVGSLVIFSAVWIIALRAERRRRAVQ